MKFEVGDTVFYDWIGYAEEVKIIKCYPNTDRYRVQHENNYQSTVKASEIFETENELWQSKIDTINNKIEHLKETRDKYKKNITQSHGTENSTEEKK